MNIIFGPHCSLLIVCGATLISLLYHFFHLFQKNSHSSKEDGLAVEIETAVPKQPIPIPVLHASLNQDDLPPKEISSKSFEGMVQLLLNIF